MSARSKPINLNLFTIRFPIPAILSILHRLSGFALFLFIPFMLWLFNFSLTENGFALLQKMLSHFFMKFILWSLFIPFCLHFIAGIRHLLMDVQIGVALKTGKITAILTFVSVTLLIILVGIWLW